MVGNSQQVLTFLAIWPLAALVLLLCAGMIPAFMSSRWDAEFMPSVTVPPKTGDADGTHRTQA